MTAAEWPSDQPGGRRTRAGRPARRDQPKSDWVTPLLMLLVSVSVIAGLAATVFPFIFDTFQQFTEAIGAGK